jgi:short-subunit dehydrogenase
LEWSVFVKRLAIFGAGPGLGLAAARRFGREGYKVELVSRNGQRLRSFVDSLAEEGVQATAHPQDLGDRSRHAELIEKIGPVDVALINGYVDQEHLRAVRDIDVDSMLATIEGAVLAPISLTRLLLPHMLASGNGAILYGLGASARVPMPPLAGAGSAQASLRNYAFNLNLDLAPHGIYVGALTVGALVRNSDAEQTFDTDIAARRGFDPERVDPADLAERLWTMVTERKTSEETVGALANA